MSSPHDLLCKLLKFLKTSAHFSSFPLSILLIGLEALLDKHFSCPCNKYVNIQLTLGIFVGPAFFTFCLMFLFLRPFRHGWFHCPDGENDDTQNWPKALISCLIPPVMWIFILLLDGDYFACGSANCDGDYVFDKKLNISWCKPFSEDHKNTLLCQSSNGKIHDTLIHLHKSQVIGYYVISVFSVFAIVLVGIHDCCTSGKCDWCPSRCLCCCGRRLHAHRTQPSSPTGTHSGEPGSSATAKQREQEPGSSATAEQRKQEPGSSATAEQREQERQREQEPGTSATAEQREQEPGSICELEMENLLTESHHQHKDSFQTSL